MNNVTLALIIGVTISFCCRAGKIPDNQICFSKKLQHDKVYLRSLGNNKGVARIYFAGPKYPDCARLLDFLLLVLLVLRAALPSPTATPVIYYYDPPLSISPGYYCHGNSI